MREEGGRDGRREGSRDSRFAAAFGVQFSLPSLTCEAIWATWRHSVNFLAQSLHTHLGQFDISSDPFPSKVSFMLDH